MAANVAERMFGKNIGATRRHAARICSHPRNDAGLGTNKISICPDVGKTWMIAPGWSDFNRRKAICNIGKVAHVVAI